jgi:hypothetical protein
MPPQRLDSSGLDTQNTIWPQATSTQTGCVGQAHADQQPWPLQSIAGLGAARPLSIITQSKADLCEIGPGEPTAWCSAIHCWLRMQAGGRLTLQRCAAPLRTRRKRQMERCRIRLDGYGSPSGSMFTSALPAIPSNIPCRWANHTFPPRRPRASLVGITQALVTLSALEPVGASRR